MQQLPTMQTNQIPLLQQNFEQQINQQVCQYFLPVTQDIRQSFNPDDDQFAAELNSLQIMKRSKHIRSLIAQLVLIVGLTVPIFLYCLSIWQVELQILIILCVGVYVLYLLISLGKNTTLSYLSNIEAGMNFQSEYNRVREIVGHFQLYAECYHYETRHHTRTVTSNGQTRTESYTTSEKVITYKARQLYRPVRCQDDSGPVGQISASTSIIFVHNKVNYRFRDDLSRFRFDQNWESFQARNRSDVHQKYTQTFILPGLKTKMTFYVGETPFHLKKIYIISTLLGLIWPYSLYMETKISRYNLQYMKIVSFV